MQFDTMNGKQQQMTQWLDGKISSHGARCEELQRDDRRDEANFEKIAGNVYDIFRTVLSAAEKPCGGQEAAVADFFRKRLEQIPGSWQAAYQQAEAHGDTKKMHIERIKLDAVAEIWAEFNRIWEVET